MLTKRRSAVRSVRRLRGVNVAGLLKIKRVMKPASPERMGRNPATGEPMMFKAKPARTVVKSQPLKLLKDFVK